jgi:predicted phage-related endonuclease
MPQRSDEWVQVRVGKLTASQAGKMLATTKTGWSAQRHDLRMQLACERLTKHSCQTPFTSDAVQHGIDQEDASVRFYEGLNGAIVDRSVGFLESDDGTCGCSPDGLVVDGHVRGLLECKNPTTKNHVIYMRSHVVPPQYVAQLTHSLFVAGPDYKFIDFFSFDSRLPPGLQAFCVREWRNEAKMTAHAEAVAVFLREIHDEVDSLRSLQHTQEETYA